MFLRSLVTVTLLLCAQLSALAQPGTIDPAFNNYDVGFVVNGRVFSSALQSDGKLLIGGDFRSGGFRSRIVRLTATGYPDLSFDPGSGFNNSVQAIAVQPDGKILVGGLFTSYNGGTANYLVRLNADGTRDASFTAGTGPNNDVYSILVQGDGKILIGGAFTTYNGAGAVRVLRLNANGTLDNTFSSAGGPNGVVLKMALQADGKVLVMGGYNSINGTAATGIARLSSTGALDGSFAAGMSAGSVKCAVVQSDGKVLIGGSFTTVGGTARNRLARLNSNGTLDATFAIGSGADGTVQALRLLSDGRLLVAGEFFSFNGGTARGVARLTSAGATDASFTPGTGINPLLIEVSSAYDIFVQSDGKLLFAGYFGGYNAVTVQGVVRTSGDGVYDPTYAVGTGASSNINAIAVQADGKIVVGGLFGTYNGKSVGVLTRLLADGTPDPAFSNGFTDYITNYRVINSVAVQPDGKILFAGSFNSYAGTTRNRIARANADGTLDLTFNAGSGPNNLVRAMLLQADGKVVIAGDFTSVNGTARNYIARLNADGSVDAAFNPGSGFNNVVYALALQPDGKIIAGGAFTTFNGSAKNRLVRLTSAGAVDPAFNSAGSGADNGVESIVFQPGGRIFIAGSFVTYNGVSRANLALLNTDGTLNTGFVTASGWQNSVKCLLPLADGRVLAGGGMASISSGLALLSATGSVDLSFNTGAGFSGDAIYALAVSSSGKIIVGTSSVKFNSVYRNGILQLAAPVTLTTGTVSPLSYCSGSAVNVPFTAQGDYAADNVFTAQLSAANGSFTNPVNIGSLQASTSGIIVAQVPGGTATGSAYRIRVVASNPAITGSTNSSNIAINNAPAIPTISSGGVTSFCAGGSVVLTSSATSGNQWYRDTVLIAGATARSYTATTSGNYQVTASSASCASVPSAATSVAVYSYPSAPVVTALGDTTVCAGSSVSLQASGSGGNVLWYQGGNPVNSLGSSVLQASVSGSYTARLENNGCLSPISNSVQVTIQNGASGQFDYAGSPYCSNAGIVTPAFAGTGGGTFTATPAGLSINSATGAVSTGASQPGGYLVSYTAPNANGCNGITTTDSIYISTQQAAAIRYIGSPFCQSASMAAVSLTGPGGGNFSASPSGLSINSSSGTIDIGASAPGTYTVNYILPASGGCGAATASTSVRITTTPAVAAPANQALCAGTQTAPVAFATTPAGSVVRWTNNKTSVGLAAVGYGTIPAFAATNNTPVQQTASLTATAMKGFVYVVKSGNNNALSVISRGYNEVAFDIPIGSAPDGVAVSANGSMIATADWGSDQVTFINANTHTVLGTAAVGSQPYSLAFSANGATLYVANLAGNSVSVVDVATRSVTATIGVGTSPVAIAASRDGSRMYVANSGSNTVSVINTSNNTILTNVTITGAPSDLAVSPDGTRVYVSRSNGLNLMAINTATFATSLVANVGAGNSGVAVSPDGMRVYVGRYSSAEVYVVNTVSNSVETTISVGAGVQRLALSADGATLYTSNQGGNSVTVVNTGTNSVVANIAGVSFPSGIAVSPDAICAGTTQNFSIAVDPQRSATIGYGADVLCTNAGAASVSINGAPQGVFSASPSGLQIDSNTGTITPAQSTPGTYVVRYFLSAIGTCQEYNAYDTVTIATPSTTFIRYSGSPYCPGQGIMPVTKVGSASGTFSASPAGVAIDPATGAINTNTSQAGTYTVTFTLSNPPVCGNATAQAIVIVSPLPIIDPLPNQTLCSGGTLTAPVTGTAAIHDWTNSDTSIGLPAASSGMIWGYPVHNYTNAPITSTVTYYPRNMGHQAWVPLYSTNNVLLYNISTGQEWMRVPVGTMPMGVAVSPDGSRVYVTNNGSANVSVISPNAYGVIATIPVGSQPYGVAVSPDGSRVYVANQGSNSVSVINAATNSIIANIPVGGANAIAVNPAGTKVYVSSFDNRVYIINTASNTVVKNVLVGSAPEGIDFTPDGSRIYIANQLSNNVTVMDGNSDVVIATMPAGVQPEGVVVSKDGSKVYVVNQVSDNVFVFNTSTNTLLDSIAVGRYPEAASLTQDGSQLFVTNVGGRSISVINTATNQVVNTIPTTANPYGLGNFISPFKCTGEPQSFTVTVYPAPAATIDYAGSPYCTIGGMATVSQTGTGGGHYSASPSGLSLNAADGSISLESSQP
ncbi:MAG: hypothetical protein EOO08_11970, partial [Chitinophagaceae bacterium]